MTDLQSQIAADLATLREIEARTQKAISACQRVAFDARADEVREAVREAVSELYFYPSSDSHGKLSRIVHILAPEIAHILDNDGARQAFRVTHQEIEE